jgi:hypothetical protein
MGLIPSKTAQQVWVSPAGQDFIQLMAEGGGVLGWIDSNGDGQGGLAGAAINGLTGAINIVPGSNVTITTTGNTISISAGGAGAVNFADEEVPGGATPGTAFTLAFAPNPAKSLILVWNGVVLKPGGVDYTLSGSNLSMVQTVQTGDSFICWYRH